MCVCVCACVRVCVSVCVSVCVWMDGWMDARTYVCMYVLTDTLYCYHMTYALDFKTLIMQSVTEIMLDIFLP